MITRRDSIVLCGFAITGCVRHETADADERDLGQLRSQWRRFLPDGFDAPSAAAALELSDDEWKSRLAPQPYRILRNARTEAAGSSPLNAENRAGVYACAGCDLPLFTSQMKFDSGTGWPSFFTTIPDVFETQLDFVLLLPRTEYHCARCGGHHGHVFNDGPAPTGKRWCNNGAALRFLPRD